MRIFKYALIAIGCLVIVFGAALAYVAATFDPNAYKPRIVQLVKDKKQRTLRLEGDIRLAFWPSLGANLGRLSLSESRSEKEFLAVENARVSLKLMPLLARQAVVDEIAIKGLRANLVRFKDGRMNFDDLLAKDEPGKKGGAQPAAGQVGLDIDHIVLENASVNFRDDTKGAHYSLSGFNLKTGRIAPGVPSRIELALTVQGDKPKINLATKLKTRLTFDLDRQIVSLEDLDLDAKGEAAGITKLVAKASGSATARLKAGEFSSSKLSISMTGARGADQLDLRLDAPRLDLSADRAAGDKVMVVAKITGAQSAFTASLGLPSVEGTSSAFRSLGMTLDLEMKQGERGMKARVASPLTGSLQARQAALPQLQASVTVSGPQIPGGRLGGELAGSAGIDAGKGTAQANLAGKVGASTIKARFNVANLVQPAITFDLDADQLDLDQYLPPKAAGAAASAGAKGGAAAEQPVDLSRLRDLRASGAVRIGSLKARNVKAANVRLDIKSNGGRVDVNPVAANLYQGTLSGALSINAAPATPVFAIRQNLAGVSIGPLLKDLADNDTLEGRGNITVDVTSQGNTVTVLKRALNGAAAVKLNDGAVKGIDIAGSIRKAKARLGTLRGEQTQAADKSQKTDFSELSATFTIRNGVAANNDLSLKSPLLRVGGEGTVDLGQDSINYLVKASVVGTTKGQGGRDVADLRGLTVPVRVSGPLAAPSYKLDFSAMATDAAKQQVEKAITERLLGGGAKKDSGGGGGSLRDSIKGLFGR
jgi:AsmA protein